MKDTTPKATFEELYILKHSLGIAYGNRKPYRNHFVADESHSDWGLIQSLVLKGLMEEREATIALCGRLFVVTKIGMEIIQDKETEGK